MGNNETLTCPWCGASGELASFERTPDGKGCWCPDCDGLFFKKPDEDKRRMLLLLESRDNKKEVCRHDADVPKLRKRLSPLRYPGGKSKTIDNIYRRLNKEQLDTFVELFAGGASLGLSLLDAGIINKLVLNDLDPLVANFWRVATNKEQCAELIRILENRRAPTMQDYWSAKWSLIPDNKSHSPTVNFASGPVPSAYGFLLLNRLSFGGILKANPICGKNGADSDLQQRWCKDALIQRLSRIRELSDHIEVYQMDALDLMQENAGWLNRATIFVDPPYVGAGKKLYRETFEEQHGDLADMLNEFYRAWPGPDIIITYDDCEMIRGMYPYATVEILGGESWSIFRK